MAKLTPREKQVVAVVQKNPELTVNGISQQTGLKRNTTKFHLYNAYSKLQVKSRQALIVKLQQVK